jgi:hypothetical protein
MCPTLLHNFHCRHSPEGGNPLWAYALADDWIPALAGMTLLDCGGDHFERSVISTAI